MATPNPKIADELSKARAELEQLKAEKARLFPPNPHPFVEPDKFPGELYPGAGPAAQTRWYRRSRTWSGAIQELQDRLFTG